MKPVISLLLVLIAVIRLSGQTTLDPEWVLLRQSPVPTGNAEAWNLGLDQNGNIFWVTSMTMPGFNQSLDIRLIKMQNDTSQIWSSRYGGQFTQQAYNLKVTDSMVIVGGRSCTSNRLDLRGCDALVVAFDPLTGDTLWTTIWDQGFGYEEVDGIVLKEDGIYISGWTVSGTSPTDHVDVMLLKLDYSGNVIWETTFGAPGRNDHQDGHIVVDDDYIFLAGLHNGNPGTNPIFLTKDYNGKSLLAKFDRSNGQLVDSVTFGRNDAWVNAENALGMTSDGTHLFITGYTTPEENNWDVFLAKYDKNLNRVWYTTWGGNSTEAARSLVISAKGNIYVGCNTSSYGEGDLDVALLKFNPDGNLEWYKTWGAEGKDNNFDMYLDNNILYLTGRTDSYHSTNKNEAYLLKVILDNELGIIDNFPFRDFEHELFPNPAKGFVRIRTSKILREASIEMFDLTGRRIRTYFLPDHTEHELDIRNLEPGIYFYNIYSQEEKTGHGMLVVQ